jgi:hypothetical protein
MVLSQNYMCLLNDFPFFPNYEKNTVLVKKLKNTDKYKEQALT